MRPMLSYSGSSWAERRTFPQRFQCSCSITPYCQCSPCALGHGTNLPPFVSRPQFAHRLETHRAARPDCEARDPFGRGLKCHNRSEEHTSELQSLMSISYAVICLKKKKK